MRKQTKTMNQLKDSRLLYDQEPPAFGYMLILITLALFVVVAVWSVNTPKIYMVRSNGNVQSTNKNYVMPSYTGEIQGMSITEGMNVEEGDSLFTIKSSELDLQDIQLQGQKEIYEVQVAQSEKLVQSIKDDSNGFDPAKPEENLYYSQFEAYKSQIAQQQVDVSTYKSYGYTDEQIEAELEKNQNKISELYHSTIKTVEDSILQAKAQLDSVQAQLDAVGSGQSGYTVHANATGIVHMMADYRDGMVVQAASPIASISSENDEYTIVSPVSAADAARVRVGDKVDILLLGLPQTIYGTITGKVSRIDSDITAGQNEDGGASDPYFKVSVVPDYTYLVSRKGDKVRISNGMAVETRIQYDKISYFNYVLESLGLLFGK
ncbi:HlyD family secretion protein [Lachnospiraceae bacterium ZAX-1]